jgi:lipopolysaccharide export system protein LptC
VKTRFLALVIVLVIVAIAAGWIYESRVRPGADRAELIIPDNIDYFLSNLRYRVMNTDGTLDYEFKSRRMEHYPRTDVSNIEQPSLQIRRAWGQWQVNSLDGEFLHQDNLLRLSNQVVMQKQGDNPMQVYTESIRFEPDQNLVSSEASVLIRNKRARIEAEQAIFDLAGKVYRFSETHSVYYHDDS